MPAPLVRRGAALLAFVLCLLLSPRAHGQRAMNHDEPPLCSSDCWTLSGMTIRGSVTGGLTFELHGTVRSQLPERIPLFGPPGEVRLDDLAIDGGKPEIAFDNDRYYLLTSAKSFTLHGRLTLGHDQMLSVAGPLLTVDAQLSKGRLVEGAKLSGVEAAVLHFEANVEGASPAAAKPARPPVFRLSRAIRYASETSFVYRLVSSQEDKDLGTLRLPLLLGEKVHDVQGSAGWTVEGQELLLPTAGRDAEITVSGALPARAPGAPNVLFKPDDRSAYEWWMIEVDPEHRVAVGGEGKLVETSQSPIPSTMPGARVYLVQRNEQLEVDAQSLVRGDALAAVARTNRRFVAITGTGELISDETIAVDNNGLQSLMFGPAGKAMYLSTDAAAQPILHTAAGSRDVLVPLLPGSHRLRVQSLDGASLSALGGALRVPGSTYPIATSAMEVTVGLPEHVHPIAVLGGDRTRWAFSNADFLAAALGIAIACFGFRTHRTRALGAVVMAGLWLVSREGYVVAFGALFTVGGTFLASRFVSGLKLSAAAAVLFVVALFSGRWALTDGVAIEPAREMLVDRPTIPVPEITHATLAKDGTLDTKAAITPISLSIPTSERYVTASRQLVTNERPLDLRVVYVTSTLLTALELGWAALAFALAWLHRAQLAALRARIARRLERKPEPAPATPFV